MPYKINEIFYSIQGEGYHAGRPAVFIRFSGCNLECAWCDTEHSQFVEMTKNEIRHKVLDLIRYPATNPTFHDPAHRPLLIFTGGEPSIQLDNKLIEHLREAFSFMHFCIETNGTKDISKLNLDWITVSPKMGAKLMTPWGSEIKIVYPAALVPHDFENMNFTYWYIQPLWVPDETERLRNREQAIRYVMENPKWRLSGQLQKFYGIK